MQLYNDDCLHVMKNFNPQSIDLILCDLPYAITKMKWDSLIPLDQLWEQYVPFFVDLFSFLWYSDSESIISIFEKERRN